MSQTIFIQTNNKQLLGAKVAKYAIQSKCEHDSVPQIVILNVDDMPIFTTFNDTSYLHTTKEMRRYSRDDLQSFTLSRFMPPELMNYAGKAIVIDPDIFTLCDINELFAFDMHGHAIAACPKKGAWDTSVMLLDCAQLTHWKIDTILTALRTHQYTYRDIMTLNTETASIIALPRIWNQLDELTPKTKLLHTTNRLTQPWKTGLPIDFARNKLPKVFGIIPREPLYKRIGKIDSHYQPHPRKEIEQLFFLLLHDAYTHNAITYEEILHEIEKKHIRSDILKCLAI